MTLAAGVKLGPYEILSPLGAGGMGEVYRARDTRLGREVAVKVLPEEMARDPERLRRFEGEARAASTISDPHIVTVFDVGAEDGLHFFASELVEGSDLRHLLDRGAMPLKKSLDLAGQIAAGLAAAHEKGIVHRDLKPENILITRSGVAKIADFGLAKLAESSGRSVSQLPTSDGHQTSAGVVMGTVGYMSPEQVRAQAVDHRSDIFSFGTVLYEMLTGCRPFARETPVETMSAILKEEPPELSDSAAHLPAAIAHVVEHCLEKNPDRRFQSARDVVFALCEIETFSSGSAPPLPTERLGGAAFGGTARRLVWPAAGVAVVAVAASLFLFVRRAPALTERDTILLADVVNTTGDPIFDGTLKQALAVTLGQSPHMNILPDTQVGETLRYMKRAPDERITREIAREICERQGLKAMLLGSIAGLGSHYVITLEAVNARTGDALAREQAEAANKEDVLAAVDRAATSLRKRLGESLPSLQKFDAPLVQATTSSLEALKAFSIGRQIAFAGKFSEAIPHFKRAADLDPNFAMAFFALATMHENLGDTSDDARRLCARAFALRGRVTDREKLHISAMYYWIVTNELDKWIEANEVLAATYPRDPSARNNLALGYINVGKYEKALEQANEGLRLTRDVMVLHSNLGWALRALGRYDEAKTVFAQALARNLDYYMIHYNLYLIAFARNDRAGMRHEVEWAAGKDREETLFLAAQFDTATFSGRFREAEEIVRRGVEATRRGSEPLAGAGLLARASSEYAVASDCGRAKRDAASAAAAVGKSGGDRPGVADALGAAGVALAVCEEFARAEQIAETIARDEPTNSWVHFFYLPLIRGSIQTGQGRPEEAISTLQKARPFEMGQGAAFWPQYFRGQAFLRLGRAKEAASEFQVIVDHRSIAPADIAFPLAHLGLARAAALAGDPARSRKAYRDFFALWKDADPDIPILQQARRESAQR